MEWPEITKETPLEEIKRIHQRIWDYVIEHGEKPKTPYIANCVVCESRHIQNADFICMKCPIAWPNNLTCMDYYNLYCLWARQKDREKSVKLARQIRDLPFKYELEEK